MQSALLATRERAPGSERVDVLAAWLANQRAVPRSQTEQTAWQLIEEARRGSLVLDGPKAPIIVQERFSLWLVGQLGGRPLLHIFVAPDQAVAKAKLVGQELGVQVLVIDRGGDIAERYFDFEAPIPTAPTHALDTPKAPETSSAPTLKVDRHEHRWGVFLDGRVVATAPTREKARHLARALKADPDFSAESRPASE